jgi:hypothetical protein
VIRELEAQHEEACRSGACTAGPFVAKTWTPSLTCISAAIRSSPHVTFARAIAAIRHRTSTGSGRPRALDFHRDNGRNLLRCHRLRESGFTIVSNGPPVDQPGEEGHRDSGQARRLEMRCSIQAASEMCEALLETRGTENLVKEKSKRNEAGRKRLTLRNLRESNPPVPTGWSAVAN